MESPGKEEEYKMGCPGDKVKERSPVTVSLLDRNKESIRGAIYLKGNY